MSKRLSEANSLSTLTKIKFACFTFISWMQKSMFRPVKFPEIFTEKWSLQTFRGGERRREEERVIRVTVLSEAWDVSSEETSFLLGCWIGWVTGGIIYLPDQQNFTVDISLLLPSMCTYACIHIYLCTHTNVHMHTHMHQDSRIFENTFGKSLQLTELTFIGSTGHSLYYLIL